MTEWCGNFFEKSLLRSPVFSFLFVCYCHGSLSQVRLSGGSYPVLIRSVPQGYLSWRKHEIRNQIDCEAPEGATQLWFSTGPVTLWYCNKNFPCSPKHFPRPADEGDYDSCYYASLVHGGFILNLQCAEKKSIFKNDNIKSMGQAGTSNSTAHVQWAS